MASRKKKTDVDGFSVLKAAQQAAQSGKADAQKKKKPESKSASDPPGGSDPPAAAKKTQSAKNPYAKAKRTAMPTAREVVCYECGTSLEIKGAMTNTVCHKCRTRLEIKDHTIEGAWADEIVTAGTVTIGEDAEVQDGGSIVANNIVLRGTVSGGSARASRAVQVETEAPVDFKQVETRDLVFPKEICYNLGDQVMRFRNVDVEGELTGRLKLSGLLRIHPGGLFCGAVEGAHIEVKEGGGLKAELNIVSKL